MAVNVLGTWHVLLAAEAARTERVIHFSSVAVFGIFEGRAVSPTTSRSMTRTRGGPRDPTACPSAWLRTCAPPFSTRTGIPTLALRPVWVWDPGMYQRMEDEWRADPGAQIHAADGEFGLFVDVRDVATAVRQALTVSLTGHHRVLLSAADVAATEPSIGIAARIAPAVPVRKPGLLPAPAPAHPP